MIDIFTGVWCIILVYGIIDYVGYTLPQDKEKDKDKDKR
jgi:hypothetical protein